MKWFKHMTCSGDDEKLSAIMDELGMEGYGFYWRLLEIVAEKLDQKGETSCQFSAKKWGNFFQFSPKKFQKFAEILAEKRLISVEISEKFVKIDIPNLLKYRDNHQKNLQAAGKKVPLNNINNIKEEEIEEDINTPYPSNEGNNDDAGEDVLGSREDGTNPRALGTNPRAKETNPRATGTNPRANPYSQEFETFWQAYPKKTGKDAAWRAWQAKKREKRLPPVSKLIEKLEQFKQTDQWQRDGGQYVPNPATWINQCRWLDELPDDGQQQDLERMTLFIRGANRAYG